MRKFTLDADALRVESFVAAEPVPRGRGTVHGQAVKPSVTCETQVETCETLDCPPNNTYEGWTCETMCDVTSWHSCYNTCVFPCEV